MTSPERQLKAKHPEAPEAAAAPASRRRAAPGVAPASRHGAVAGVAPASRRCDSSALRFPLNPVRPTAASSSRLLDESVTPGIFHTARMPCNRNTVALAFFTFSPSHFRTFQHTADRSDRDLHRGSNADDISNNPPTNACGALLLINGVPVAQIELKTLGINPRRAIEQIVEYKNHPGAGSCGMFVQSEQLARAHDDNKADVSILSQNFYPTTWRSHRMNLAIVEQLGVVTTE